MKRILVLLLLMLTVLSFVIITYKPKSYNISEMENMIGKDYQIKNSKEVEDFIVTIYESPSGMIGRCIFKKRAYGKVIIISKSGEMQKPFEGIVLRYNEENRLIILGKKGDSALIVAKFDGYRDMSIKESIIEEFVIPEEEYYIIIKELDSNYSYDYDISEETKIFDINGNDISREYIYQFD